MKHRRTAVVFGVLVGAYGAALLPALFWPGYLDSPMGVLALVPFLSVYLFHGLGVPGLLQHAGACGWGWCAPTVFGWVFMASFWLGLAWLVAVLCRFVWDAKASSDGRSGAERASRMR